MSATRHPEVLLHEAHGLCFLLDGEQMIVRRDGEEAAWLNLATATDRQGTGPGGNRSLGDWRREGDRYVAVMEGLEARVVLGVEHGYVFCEMETEVGFFPELVYFPDSRIHASRWQTFVYNSDDRLWVADQDKEVIVTAVSKPVGEVQATWYANVAPHVAAFKLCDGSWLGISVPGPLPVAETRFCWISRRFSLVFDHLMPSCQEGGMPRVYLIPGLPEPEAALEVHATLTRAMGYWRDRSSHPSWWSLPVWGLYDENCCLARSGVNPPPAEQSTLTSARVKEWTQRVEDITGLREFFVMAEQGYFSRYGEFGPVESLGGTEGMRDLVHDLHRDGKRVGLYFHPFFIDRSLSEIEEHPEWLAQGDASLAAVPISQNMHLGVLDWTRPEARDYMRERIRYVLSAEPGCLDADWLCVHNNHAPDPREWQFHDPHWGVGDLMKYKVMRDVYRAAKAAKPDAMVRWIVAESWAQPFVDRVYLNEDWSDTCDNWFRMARIVTRTLPGTLVDATPWFLSRAKAREFWMVLPAFGIACNHPLSHFRVGRRGDWERAQREDHRRWRASWQVYMNAPMTADQERRLDYREGEVFACRINTAGPLAGSYAARTFGRRCFATYSPTQACLTATEDLTVDVPLPLTAAVDTIEEVLHDGRARTCEAEVVVANQQASVRLTVRDSGGETLCYRVRYHLHP